MFKSNTRSTFFGVASNRINFGIKTGDFLDTKLTKAQDFYEDLMESFKLNVDVSSEEDKEIKD